MGEKDQVYPTKRIAIVGCGISGIACAWKLRKQQNCIVNIYESNSKPGGHADAVLYKGRNGQNVHVDMGFIAMDEETYPQFTAFLRELNVKTIPTDMSFGVSTVDRFFEWGSYGLKSFVGNWANLLRPWFWRLMFDILRFTIFAQDALFEDVSQGSTFKNSTSGSLSEKTDESHLATEKMESIGEYLRRKRYSSQFIRLFLIPMVAAPWCICMDEFEKTFPAKALINFMLQHRLLDTVSKTLRWRSFRNSSKTYIDAFQESLTPNLRLHLNTSVQRVKRHSAKSVSLQLDGSTERNFDHVLLAVHANQALELLGDEATPLERQILSGFKTSRNECCLHSDTSLLAGRPSARVAWNCLLSDDQCPGRTPIMSKSKSTKASTISITFDMNKLQAIPSPDSENSPGRVLVTMNPTRTPGSLQSKKIYYHPLISSESISMSRNLHRINHVSNVSFAGAWMGFGFHEDGFAAGSHAAKMMMDGGQKTDPLDFFSLPLEPVPRFSWRMLMMRWCIAGLQFLVEGLEDIGGTAPPKEE